MARGMSDAGGAIADLRAARRGPEQKAWYWYDWANSAYVTTVATVLFAPYLIAVAEQAACGRDDRRAQVPGTSRLGLVARGARLSTSSRSRRSCRRWCCRSLGAVADRTAHKKGLLAGFAWAGAPSPALLFF